MGEGTAVSAGPTLRTRRACRGPCASSRRLEFHRKRTLPGLAFKQQIKVMVTNARHKGDAETANSSYTISARRAPPS